MIEFMRYCLVGVINTIIGFGLVLLFSLVFIPELANSLGYGIGICISYVLNSYFTFRGKKGSLARFFICALLAYGLNLFVLFLLYRVLGYEAIIAQVCAAATYTICSFLLSRYFAFRSFK